MKEYFKSYFGDDYYIPVDKRERFVSLNERIKRASQDKDHAELYRGLEITFKDEFRKYIITFKKGNIWSKKKEEWCGNNPKGTEFKIVGVKGSFVFFVKIKRIWGFKIGTGYVTCLNKLSFLDIFERKL
jgi:hypothetical protein